MMRLKTKILAASVYVALIVTLFSLYRDAVPHRPTSAKSRQNAQEPIGHSSLGKFKLDISKLDVTYENCIAGLPSNSRKRLRKILWLHIPKCGTSLGTVVHGYLCQSEKSPHTFRKHRREAICDYCELEEMNKQGTPYWDGKIRNLLPVPEIRKYCDWNVSYGGGFFGHTPLRSNQRMGHKDDAAVIALFRDPRRRVTSAWNHGKHTHHLGTKDAEMRFPHSRELLEKETQTLHDFARHKHVRGCQVKMLVGGQCGMFHNITAAVYAEASLRLQKLAFVGLTDAYNASVCLFHHMYGGIPQPHMFANARPAQAHREKWKPRKLPGGGMQVRPSAWKTLSLNDDPDDSRLFLEATALFKEKLIAYGFDKPPYYSSQVALK